MEQQEQITVLVHGTFANLPPKPGKSALPKWWRRSEVGLTADRLQGALEQLQPALADTVWYEGQNADDKDSKNKPVTYETSVEWTSENKHKDRVRAAKNLARSLEIVADGRECTPKDPLLVNYVAHSHGGNVVLESLKHLEQDNVQPRQVSLLGTPLIWRRTDLRIGYLGILFLFFYFWILLELEYLTDGRRDDPDAWSLAGEIIFSVVFVTLLFWIAFGIIWLFRRLSDSSSGKPAYGPEPDVLKEKLGTRPVVLFISDEDEADLMLQLGAAPLDTYRALIRGRPSMKKAGLVKKVVLLPIRFIELFFIRPLAYAIVVPLLEILLERFGLGFSFRSVMVRNYEMTTWTPRDPYKQAIERVPIEPEVLEQAQIESDEPQEQPQHDASAPLPAHGASREVSDKERIDELRTTLVATFGGLKDQVHLSHSGYYLAQKIIDDVASVIAASDEEVTSVIAGLKASSQSAPLREVVSP